MPGINSVLSIASRSLWASQTGVEVASHNIANMNTPGYVRQNLVLTAATPLANAGLLYGNGVDVTAIRSVQDRYLNFQMFQAKSLLGFRSANSDGLSNLQEIFNESDEVGLSIDLNNFFTSWQELSANPEGSAGRVGLVSNAQVLTNQFHMLSGRLTDVREAANDSVAANIDDVNSLARQIFDLNKRIQTYEGAGQTAGDFRATRTALLDELASLVDFHSYEDGQGRINVILAGGRPLVESGSVGSLQRVGNAEGYWDVDFVSAGGDHYDITDQIAGGSLAGQLKTRDSDAVSLLDKLNEMAYQLVTSVNTQHQLGFGLNGNTGADFFVALASADDAATLIQVDSAITSDANNIAASASGDTGDNQIALAIAGLQKTDLFNGGTWTFQEFYGSIVSEAGVNAQAAVRDAEHQQNMVDQIVSLRESKVGVSMDEEMANLMKYQFSYQAASRLYSVVNDMFDVLANLG